MQETWIRKTNDHTHAPIIGCLSSMLVLVCLYWLSVSSESIQLSILIGQRQLSHAMGLVAQHVYYTIAAPHVYVCTVCEFAHKYILHMYTIDRHIFTHIDTVCMIAAEMSHLMWMKRCFFSLQKHRSQSFSAFFSFLHTRCVVICDS